MPGTWQIVIRVPIITQESSQIRSVNGLNLCRSDDHQICKEGSGLWPHKLSGENLMEKLRSKCLSWFDHSLFRTPHAWHTAWLVLSPHYLFIELKKTSVMPTEFCTDRAGSMGGAPCLATTVLGRACVGLMLCGCHLETLDAS